MKKHLLLCLLAVFIGMPALADKSDSRSKGWLLDAKSDEKRFELLQRYLRGFDPPMYEVGQRYVAIHEALSRANYELASHHWENIKDAIEIGYMKRPDRQANADRLFLDRVWDEVDEAFGSNNADMAWTGFERARDGCMACHVAEDAAYMNNQAKFDLRRPAQ